MDSGGPCAAHKHRIVGNGGRVVGVGAGNVCNRDMRDCTAACRMVSDTAWAVVGRWAVRVPLLPHRGPLVVRRRECAPGLAVAVALLQPVC